MFEVFCFLVALGSLILSSLLSCLNCKALNLSGDSCFRVTDGGNCCLQVGQHAFVVIRSARGNDTDAFDNPTLLMMQRGYGFGSLSKSSSVYVAIVAQRFMMNPLQLLVESLFGVPELSLLSPFISERADTRLLISAAFGARSLKQDGKREKLSIMSLECMFFFSVGVRLV